MELRERIRELLDQGMTRRDVARTVGVNPSTITRYARLLGYPDHRRRESRTDWAAVQRHYDDGHTISECKARFGFSYGAWTKLRYAEISSCARARSVSSPMQRETGLRVCLPKA